MGNLTRDPEVRYTPAGMAVLDLRMAMNRKYKAADGELKEETCFVTVTVWGRQAETSGQYLRKGSPVMIEGRLKYDEWEKDGQKQNRLGVVAERVQFLGSGGAREAGAREADAHEAAEPPEAAHPTAPHPEEPRGAAPKPAAGPGDDDNLPF
jgi:single-strand DNA-binding protein